MAQINYRLYIIKMLWTSWSSRSILACGHGLNSRSRPGLMARARSLLQQSGPPRLLLPTWSNIPRVDMMVIRHWSKRVAGQIQVGIMWIKKKKRWWWWWWFWRVWVLRLRGSGSHSAPVPVPASAAIAQLPHSPWIGAERKEFYSSWHNVDKEKGRWWWWWWFWRLRFPGRLLHLGQMILAVGSPSSGTKRKDRRIVAFKAFNGTAVTDSMAHRLTIPMEGKALAPTRVTLRSIIVSGMSCKQANDVLRCT